MRKIQYLHIHNILNFFRCLGNPLSYKIKISNFL